MTPPNTLGYDAEEWEDAQVGGDCCHHGVGFDEDCGDCDLESEDDE